MYVFLRIGTILSLITFKFICIWQRKCSLTVFNFIGLLQDKLLLYFFIFKYRSPELTFVCTTMTQLISTLHFKLSKWKSRKYFSRFIHFITIKLLTKYCNFFHFCWTDSFPSPYIFCTKLICYFIFHFRTWPRDSTIFVQCLVICLPWIVNSSLNFVLFIVILQ